MFVFSLFTGNNATSLREAQIGQHITTTSNIMLHFVTVCTICYTLLSCGHRSLLRLLWVVDSHRGADLRDILGA